MLHSPLKIEYPTKTRELTTFSENTCYDVFVAITGETRRTPTLPPLPPPFYTIFPQLDISVPERSFFLDSSFRPIILRRMPRRKKSELEPVPNTPDYESVTQKVVEVRTPRPPLDFTLPTKKSNSKEKNSKSLGTNARYKAYESYCRTPEE